MKIHYIAVVKNDESPAVELSGAVNEAEVNFVTRKHIVAIMAVLACTVAERTAPGKNIVAEEKGYNVHVYSVGKESPNYRNEGICGIIIADREYPDRVAQGLLKKVYTEFMVKYPRSAYVDLTDPKTQGNTLPYPELEDYIVKYQDPGQSDSIMKIQRELDETTDVIHKAMENLLERGEKIDDLVAKSDSLSAQSKMFYTQAKKQNSCCIVM